MEGGKMELQVFTFKQILYTITWRLPKKIINIDEKIERENENIINFGG